VDIVPVLRPWWLYPAALRLPDYVQGEPLETLSAVFDIA
jgi:hypothetical protein